MCRRLQPCFFIGTGFKESICAGDGARILGALLLAEMLEFGESMVPILEFGREILPLGPFDKVAFMFNIL